MTTTINGHQTAQGTKLQRGTVSGESLTWVSVANIDGVAPPAMKRKALDVTTQDQPDNNMQYVASALTENTMPAIELLFNKADAGQAALYGDFASAEPVNYQVLLPNGDTYAFLGVIIDWVPSGKKGELIKVKVTIQISGAVTYTSGS